MAPETVKNECTDWLAMNNPDTLTEDDKNMILEAEIKHLKGELAYFDGQPDGTYELCGPKVQGNPEGFEL
jgi:hypothetical protein